MSIVLSDVTQPWGAVVSLLTNMIMELREVEGFSQGHRAELGLGASYGTPVSTPGGQGPWRAVRMLRKGGVPEIVSPSSGWASILLVVRH